MSMIPWNCPNCQKPVLFKERKRKGRVSYLKCASCQQFKPYERFETYMVSLKPKMEGKRPIEQMAMRVRTRCNACRKGKP